MAYHWIIRNSRELYSPPQLDASHNIIVNNGITYIKDTLDSRLFKSQELPIMGKDQKLIFFLTFFLHVFKIPGAGSQFFHRSRTATAGYIRNHDHGIFITNSQKKVCNIIGESCFRCRRTG